MEPLLVLFNKATAQVLGNEPYYIAYSIPGGVYGYFTNKTIRPNILKSIEGEISQMIQQRVAFQHEWLPRDQILNYFADTNRKDILHLLQSRPEVPSVLQEMNLSRIGGRGELLLNHVREDHDRLGRFKLIPFQGGFFLIADPLFFERVMPQRLERSKYHKRFLESEESMKHLGIADFASLNDVINQGQLPEFIKISEACMSRRIGRIADNILAHPLKPRVIFLAGPTSSGKTTSANRLAVEFRVLKKKTLILSLDNYYMAHEAIPTDPLTGLKNFELITALDLDLFMDNIHELVAGRPVHLPKYYFDGRGPQPAKESTRIDEDTLIIVEGIHGLNPQLWQQVMDLESYRLYVSALNTLNVHDHLPLSTSDHRLIRRLVRDHLFRGYDINDNISRWPDVRQNEYQSIFPFQESAHAIFNSSLVYEIAVFAHYAPGILRAELAKDDYVLEEVKRLNRLLSLLTPINPADIPPTSILREFIGGSSFTY